MNIKQKLRTSNSFFVIFKLTKNMTQFQEFITGAKLKNRKYQKNILPECQSIVCFVQIQILKNSIN